MSTTVAMTLADFRQTGRDVADLGTIESFKDFGLEGQSGRVYFDNLYIERIHTPGGR